MKLMEKWFFIHRNLSFRNIEKRPRVRTILSRSPEGFATIAMNKIIGIRISAFKQLFM